MKATHYGNCQACGAEQKLPGGILAKHGYRVSKWARMFEGVCPGAGELPLQVSCALIERFITQTKANIARMQAHQAELRQPATEPRAWFYEHHEAEWVNGYGRKSFSAWRQVDLRVENRHGRDWQVFTDYKGKTLYCHTYSLYAPTLLDLATLMNGKMAESIQRDIDGLHGYITWQQSRIKNWKPTECREVA